MKCDTVLNTNFEKNISRAVATLFPLLADEFCKYLFAF